MMSMRTEDDTYVMGRTAGEERRLRVQADLLQEPTHRLLVNAGIGPHIAITAGTWLIDSLTR